MGYMQSPYIFILLLLLSLIAYNALIFSPQQTFEQLDKAKTPEEEAAVFRELWQNADELSFSAYTNAGEALPVSSPNFPT